MALDTVLLAVGQGNVDSIDQLAQTAIDIAGPADARVVLFHVFTQAEFDRSVSNLDFGDPADTTPEDVANRLNTIKAYADRLEEAGVRHEVRSRIGEHGELIVSQAGTLDADLVLVGGRKRTPAGKAVFGSTVQQVLLEAPCPVTFVRSD